MDFSSRLFSFRCIVYCFRRAVHIVMAKRLGKSARSFVICAILHFGIRAVWYGVLALLDGQGNVDEDVAFCVCFIIVCARRFLSFAKDGLL